MNTTRIDNMAVYDIRRDEDSLYKGCGQVIARFRDDGLVGLWYIGEHLYLGEPDAASRCVEEARQWLAAEPAAAYFTAMASCQQLCGLEPLPLNDAPSLARLARIIGDEASHL